MFISVGNKADDPDRRVVVEADARRFADQMGIRFFETSAKENLNIEEVNGYPTSMMLLVAYFRCLMQLRNWCWMPNFVVHRKILPIVNRIMYASVVKVIDVWEI